MDTQLKGKAVVLPPEPSASGGAGLGDVAVTGSPAVGKVITADSSTEASWKTPADADLATRANPSFSGTMTLSSVGARIRGDFSNATQPNRAAFQSSVLNGVTGLIAMPNGTATTSAWNLFNGSDILNASVGYLNVSSTHVRFGSGTTGSGTQLPLALATGFIDRQTILPTGEVGIGVTPVIGQGTLQVPDINGASPSGLANKIENGCMRIPSSAGQSGSVGLGQTLYGAEGIRTFIGDWSAFSGAVYQVGGVQDVRTSSGAMHYVAFGTATGASGYILYTYRIKAQEALTLAGKPLTLSCKLTAETTSASNHSFRIYKANAYDDFSGETFVSTSGNLGAVSGTLDTGAQFTLSYADCFNGIIVQVLINYTGAPVAPAYLSIADFSCRSGSCVVPFEARPLELEKALVNRFKPAAPINLTANTTLASNAKYSYSAGSLTLTLPAAPVNGDEVVIYNTGSLLTTVVGRNGKTIMGLAQDMPLDIANRKYLFEYLSESNDWRLS